MKVRTAIPQDSEEMVKLADELIHIDDWSGREVMLQESLKDPTSEIFVAESDDKIVGLIELRVFPDFVEGSPIAMIQNFVVKKDFRRQGIGNKLIRRANEEAIKQKAIEIHVWTKFDNQQAINLYSKHGFDKRYLLLEKETWRDSRKEG